MIMINTLRMIFLLRVIRNTLCGPMICFFKEKNQVFSHYSCSYRNHCRENASFGWRFPLKLQLVDVFWLEEVEIQAGEIKTWKKTGKKQIAGQNSTKHSRNSDRLHAIRQKIAHRQAADIYPPQMILPVSLEVISIAEKWKIPGRGGHFQEKNVSDRFLWSIQAKKVLAAAFWRSFYREKCPPPRLAVFFLSKTIKNVFLESFKDQANTWDGRGRWMERISIITQEGDKHYDNKR